VQRKGFGPDDFAVLHPGGALGRRLVKVEKAPSTREAAP